MCEYIFLNSNFLKFGFEYGSVIKFTFFKSIFLICLEQSFASIMHKKSGVMLCEARAFIAVPTAIRIILSRYFFKVSIFLSNVGPAETTTAVSPLK